MVDPSSIRHRHSLHTHDDGVIYAYKTDTVNGEVNITMMGTNADSIISTPLYNGRTVTTDDTTVDAADLAKMVDIATKGRHSSHDSANAMYEANATMETVIG